jgi:opacity protein-like surface antigen
MSRFVALAVCLPIAVSLMATPVVAQPEDWSGYYIGVDFGQSGGRNGDLKVSLDPARDPRLTYDIAPLNARFDRERNLGSGSSGGLRVGRLAQTGSFVWGVEAQAGLLDLNRTFVVGSVRDTRGHSNFVPNLGSVNNTTDTLTAQLDIEAAASLRARVGLPVGDRFLVSAFAGPAVAQARLSASQTSQIVITRSVLGPFGFNTITTVVDRATSGPEESKAVFGGTLGGALDYRVSGDWLLHLEAGMTVFDDIEAASGGLGGSSGGDSRVSYSPRLYAVSLGLTRRF